MQVLRQESGLHFTAARCRGHRYIALWRLDQADELLSVLERWGADPSIDLRPCEAVAIARAALKRALGLEDAECRGK